MTPRRQWNTCHCGKRKQSKAEMCAECRTDKRHEYKARHRSGYGSYFPADKRFGLLCVWGYGGVMGNGDSYGVSMSVLDGNRMWEEVSRITVNERRYKGERAALMHKIRAMNREEDARRPDALLDSLTCVP